MNALIIHYTIDLQRKCRPFFAVLVRGGGGGSRKQEEGSRPMPGQDGALSEGTWLKGLAFSSVVWIEDDVWVVI